MLCDRLWKKHGKTAAPFTEQAIKQTPNCGNRPSGARTCIHRILFAEKALFACARALAGQLYINCSLIGVFISCVCVYVVQFSTQMCVRMNMMCVCVCVQLYVGKCMHKCV